MRGFPLPAGSTPRCLFTANMPFTPRCPRERREAGRERGKSWSGLPFVPVAISWTKSYRALRQGKMEDKPYEQRNRTFFCPFQLNPHRYTLGGGSVSAIRSRVREAPLFEDNRISQVRRIRSEILVSLQRRHSTRILICERIALTDWRYASSQWRF